MPLFVFKLPQNGLISHENLQLQLFFRNKSPKSENYKDSIKFKNQFENKILITRQLNIILK